MIYTRRGPTSNKVNQDRAPKYVIEAAKEMGYTGGFLYIEKENDMGKHTGYTIIIDQVSYFIPTRTK